MSVRAGALTATPGRFMPLWSRMVPPRVTTHSTSFPGGTPGPPGRADGQDPQFHRPVGQEDRVAGADVVGEGGVARRQPLRGSGRFGDADHQAGAAGQHGGAAGEPADPQLRALEVGQDAHGPAGGVGRGAHLGVGVGVSLLVAVGEVEPGDVHPGRDQGGDALGSEAGRPDGADDLGAPGERAGRLIARPAVGVGPEQGLGHGFRP